MPRALGVIARSENMSELARRVGMSLDGLYKALSEDGKPTWSTILKVTNALGLRFELHAFSHVVAWRRISNRPRRRRGSASAGTAFSGARRRSRRRTFVVFCGPLFNAPGPCSESRVDRRRGALLGVGPEVAVGVECGLCARVPEPGLDDLDVGTTGNEK